MWDVSLDSHPGETSLQGLVWFRSVDLKKMGRGRLRVEENRGTNWLPNVQVKTA